MHVHTQLGLQPSVGLYSYSNNTYLCLTFSLAFVLVVVFNTIRPKMLLGLVVDINTWLSPYLLSSKASSTLVDTLPKQKEVVVCPSLPTLPTDRSKT